MTKSAEYLIKSALGQHKRAGAPANVVEGILNYLGIRSSGVGALPPSRVSTSMITKADIPPTLGRVNFTKQPARQNPPPSTPK
jgi:hypothetical protein